MGGSSTFSSSGTYDWSSAAAHKSAKSYADEDKRTYTGYSSRGLEPPVGKDISTNSKLPVVLALDVTGSMKEWPKFIMDRIPTMYHEMNAVLQGYDPKQLEKSLVPIKQEMEISVIAVGDANCDTHPLQVTEFQKHNSLVKSLNEIYPEGGGGGGTMESYDLAAYYAVNHVKTEKSMIKPLCYIAGDEAFYDTVKSSHVKRLIGDDLKQNLNTVDVLKQLDDKFDVYVLRPEPTYSKATYEGIHNKWKDVFNGQRVLRMEDPEAIVNCMIMLAGISSDNYTQALHMLQRREEKWEIDQALKAIHPTLAATGLAKKKA
jgi:hypothetical protein